jgi:hypothetical protein
LFLDKLFILYRKRKELIMTVDTNTATATTSGGSNSNQPVSYFDFKIKKKF